MRRRALLSVLQEIAMPYLNCSRCGLSIRVRFAVIESENCPRCLARSRVAQPLFRSRLTIHELNGHRVDAPAAAAAGPVTLRSP
jgi:hypothetical protein